MKILVIGSNGQLGKCLKDQFKNETYDVTFSTREEIDITDFEKTKLYINSISPNIIVNACAYTDVDKAENNRLEANLVNNLAVDNIANICNEIGCWLIHISTDYVFDGASQESYKEDDIKNPLSVYGDTKLKGEKAIESSNCKYIIIRTAWVFSEYGNNFMKKMIDLGKENIKKKIIDDQIGCPTYAQDIAKVILHIIPKLIHDESIKGVYHYCGNLPCSWYEFAKEIFFEANKLGISTPKTLIPIKTIDFSASARRPENSVMQTSKIQEKFEIKPSNWKSRIEDTLKKLSY